jgi:hypothetical protein
MSSIGGWVTADPSIAPTILWPLLAVIAAVGIGTFIVVGRARARALRARNKRVSRPIHEVCAARGHKYQIFGTGYRCATCGNHVSSHEGEVYGRAEDGRQERRREPR